MPPETPSPAAARRDAHLPALTGLRGLAAALVALLHLWMFAGTPALTLGPLDLSPIAASGYFGVDLFFVLSGFLLGLPFLRARMGRGPPPSLRTFWIRRARRVLPALWVQLAILFAVAYAMTGAPPFGPLEAIAQALLFFNLPDWPYINPVYWSLPVEWDFYVVLPLLALLFARGSGRPWGLALVLLFVFGFRLAIVLAGREWGVDALWFLRWIIQLPARLDQFVLGMVAAWWVLQPRHRRGEGAWMALAGAAFVLAWMWHTTPLGDVITHLKTPHVYWHYTATGLGFALLVAGAAQGAGPVLGRALAFAPLRFLGTISYSLYLWHYPALEAMRWWQGAAAPKGALWWIANLAAMLALASLSYYAVERRWLSAPRRAPFPLA